MVSILIPPSYNLSYSCGRYLINTFSTPKSETLDHLFGMPFFGNVWLYDPDCE